MVAFFNEKLGNAEGVTSAFLSALNIKFNQKSLRNKLKEHPEYPSLLSISDCLQEWLIPNYAYRIPSEEYNKEDLVFPFIAHSRQDGGRYILIHSIDRNVVRFSDELRNNADMSEDFFLHLWDGVALHAEPCSLSGEREYLPNRIKFGLQSLILPFGLIALLTVFYFALAKQKFALDIINLSLIKLAGLGVSVLLLMQSIDANNPLIQNLCGLAGKSDCNAVLKSDASKLTSWLSWSEVGFFYFAGSFLALLTSTNSINLLAWINVFALPYTIYSVSYQYKSKHWCVLCCSVQALLVLEFIGFYLLPINGLKNTSHYDLLAIEVADLITFLLCFLLPIIIWSFLKPFFTNAAQVGSLKSQLQKFKYNSELFLQALTNQPRYGVGKELMPIVLGNPNAEHVITIASNPLCLPCSKAHQEIEELLQSRNDIRVNIILSTKKRDDEQTAIVRHLLALATQPNEYLLKTATNDWFNTKNKSYDKWAKKYPAKIKPDIDSLLKLHADWIKVADIKYTPTILVDGYILPEPYKVEDLKYLLS